MDVLPGVLITVEFGVLLRIPAVPPRRIEAQPRPQSSQEPASSDGECGIVVAPQIEAEQGTWLQHAMDFLEIDLRDAPIEDVYEHMQAVAEIH
jgi:hypothetical protein